MKIYSNMKAIEDRAYDYAIEQAQVEEFDFGSVKDGYIKGARDQKKIDDENLERIITLQWKEEENLWIERYEEIRQSLIEKQGEYISLELINEIFENDIKYLEDKITQATPKLKDGELEQILDSFNE